jgi:hypothetical protein
MIRRFISAAFAAGVLMLVPPDAAFARGGGGGGGDDGGGGRGGGDRGMGGGSLTRGGYGFDRPQTDADRRLYDQAQKECNGPKYPSGATPRINYDVETFSCFEPGSTRR